VSREFIEGTNLCRSSSQCSIWRRTKLAKTIAAQVMGRTIGFHFIELSTGLIIWFWRLSSNNFQCSLIDAVYSIGSNRTFINKYEEGGVRIEISNSVSRSFRKWFYWNSYENTSPGKTSGGEVSSPHVFIDHSNWFLCRQTAHSTPHFE